MASLGQPLGKTDREELETEPNLNGDPAVDFAEFLKLMQRKMYDTDSADEVIEVFRVFDKDSTGFVSASELRHIITTYSGTLTDEEIDEMIREAKVDRQGNIEYGDFVRMMMAK